MKRGQVWLSKGIEELAAEPPQRLDVLIVGSGYGGAVAAARLSRCARNKRRLKVAVLERGLEYGPGSFPDRDDAMLAHARLSGSPADAMSAAGAVGLFDFRLGGDVWALVANGVGGGSLINAGVCEEADWKTLAHEDWPEPWLGNEPRWRELYARARARIGAEKPWPDGRVPRQAAMRDLAHRHGATYRPVSLSITPPGTRPAPGTGATPPVHPCVECGDCFSGCNVGAKLTLVQTCLAEAYRQGCAIYRGATVRRVERRSRGWRVHYRFTDPLLTPGETLEFHVDAAHVVLAAGTYGSTEILMRSQAAGLALSPRLGDGFSANGDLLSAYYDGARNLRSPPDPQEPLEARRSGPTITSQVEWQRRDPVIRRDYRVHAMQDIGVPAALGWLLGEALSCMSVPQRWTRFKLDMDLPGTRDAYAVDPEAVRRSLLTVSYFHDGAAGRIRPQSGWATSRGDGMLSIEWPALEQLGAIDAEHRRLEAIKPANTALMRNPLWQFLPDSSVVEQRQRNRTWFTVHPLGGCRMAKESDAGVVDPYGRVFDCGLDLQDEGAPAGERLRLRHEGIERRALHRGLHVLDGSIVPTSLGINPLLTICALAEGAIDHWIEDYGWRELDAAALAASAVELPLIDWRPPVAPAHRVATRIAFSERMYGDVWPPGTLDRGLTPPHLLSLAVRFEAVDDLQHFLRKPVKKLALTASLRIQARNGAPTSGRREEDPAPDELTVKGEVRWMAIEPSCVGQRLFRSVRTFARTRLLADLFEPGARPLRGLGDKIRALTHFGAVRELAYVFKALDKPWTLIGPASSPRWSLPAGTVLHGRKRVGYRIDDWSDPESTNPWLQLTEMDLHATLPSGVEVRVGKLGFDEAAALGPYNLPLTVNAQENALVATRDLLSLTLYFGRVMAGLHMFNFRGAVYPGRLKGPRGVTRLPPLRYAADDERYRNLEIESHPVIFGAKQSGSTRTEVIRLRLTRFKPAGLDRTRPPVLLIHGFGSGGIQYAHPAIPQPLAPWLAQRGHDVWVAELRTSIGLDSAQRQWIMDDIAAQDIPALMSAVLRLSGAKDVCVVAHCIGAAMFSMAALGGHLPKDSRGRPRVAAIALMQVGPRVALLRGNRARAHVMARMQQIFGLARVESVAGQRPSAAEELLDRLLGSLLYRSKQRPFYRLSHDAGVNAWRTNANRSAAVFGQLFQYENMTPAVFDAMEDLLGTCNLSTYAQTAKYARGTERLTDVRGNDNYLTSVRIRAHWKAPTLLVHGRENRVFDLRTLTMNDGLLRQAGVAVESHSVEGYGHLDCVVGRQADALVFAKIDGFLRHGVAPSLAPPPAAKEVDLRLLDCGPWLGHVEPTRRGLSLRLGGRVDKLSSAYRGIVVQEARGNSKGMAKPPGRGDPPARLHGEVSKAHVFCVEHRIDAQRMVPGRQIRLLVGAAYGNWPIKGAKPAHTDARPIGMKMAQRKQRLERDAERLLLDTPVTDALQLDPGWLARMRATEGEDLGLALVACRQRPLLVDRARADASMGALLHRLDTDARQPIDALFFAGDQIYADSRNAGSHAGLSDLPFLDAYREAYTAPAQQQVMRRRPCYMTIDDHEFRNDYGPALAGGRPIEYDGALRAWTAYQLDAGRPGGKPRSSRPHGLTATVAWRHFALRGFPCFIADTRSERYDEPSLDRGRSMIMSHRQMSALCAWLVNQPWDLPKIVLMSCPIAPHFVDAAQARGELRCDGWQRFPASLAQLLGCIARHRIKHVVFLSGDYHCFADATLTLEPKPRSRGEPPLTVRSIVTSGLYCPYPFANADPTEWLHERRLLPLPGGGHWGYRLDAFRQGSGYSYVRVYRDGRTVPEFRVV